MLGFVELPCDADVSEGPELIRELRQLANQLLEEIEAQRGYLAAERNDLAVNRSTVYSKHFLEEVARTFGHHPTASHRHIRIHPEAESVAFACDRTLLGRVLGNMTRNALEASEPGGTVTLHARSHATPRRSSSPCTIRV
jgi:signal transduction histidine kinase